MFVANASITLVKKKKELTIEKEPLNLCSYFEQLSEFGSPARRFLYHDRYMLISNVPY